MLGRLCGWDARLEDIAKRMRCSKCGRKRCRLRAFPPKKRWDGGRFTTGARVSLYGWADPDRPDRDAVSFAYVLAGGFRPHKVAGFRLEWEHDVNRLVGQRYRVMALINVLGIK